MSQESLSNVGRRQFLQGSIAAGAALSSISALPETLTTEPHGDDREFWLRILDKISFPVLQAAGQGKLKAEMPVEAPHGNIEERRAFTHLEALGRLLAGIAPWLESGEGTESEGRLRSQYAEWSRLAIQFGTDPSSPDFLNFDKGRQPVVDAAFLAHAILRAPNELWRKLDTKTQKNVVAALESSRVIQPNYTNWLLFSAMVETALAFMGSSWDPMRVDYAVRTIDSWYKGDGTYGDGPEFHWDYYNSFVIHPMLLQVLETISKASSSWDSFRSEALVRARRYAAVQERLISPEGAFPPIGRSLCYRFGAFQHLADIALRHELPEDVSPAQVRSALTAVMRRSVEAPGTFDKNGWLTCGFYGHQPAIAESYISTGSCYLCAVAWLPLGLPSSDPFWAASAEPWTSKKIWSGENIPADHALNDGE